MARVATVQPYKLAVEECRRFYFSFPGIDLGMLAEIVPTEVTTLHRQLPAFNIIMIIILYIEQGEGDIARKSMGIYTYVRSLQEVFTKLEKCRKPVDDIPE